MGGQVLEVDTPEGPARVFRSDPECDPAGTLVLGHGAGGGLNAADLVSVTGAAVAAGWRVLLVKQPWKVAGRKIVESISTSFSPGLSALSAASTLRVTSSVLPVGCFSTISSNPGPSLITASPMGGGNPSTTSATAPSSSGAPLRKATGTRARSCGCVTEDRCATGSRWLGVDVSPAD